MISPEDFRFRDDMVKADSKDTVPIEILTGPYKNVILRYTRVGIKEKEDDTAVLQFEYNLVAMGDHTETSLRKDARFQTHLGILLNHLILESVGATDNELGKNDTKEFADE
jgi:hypothetical protein